MPVSSLIVGVDLDPIKPIRGVKTLIGDITTQKTRAALRKEANGGAMDCVLHDGAPNVGGAWTSEAFTQSALVLESLRLATEFLTPGGTFVTKIFRYAALLSRCRCRCVHMPCMHTVSASGPRTTPACCLPSTSSSPRSKQQSLLLPEPLRLRFLWFAWATRPLPRSTPGYWTHGTCSRFVHGWFASTCTGELVGA